MTVILTRPNVSTVPGFLSDDTDVDLACRRLGVDPEVFFPGRGESGDEAKKVCRACPVKLSCQRWALAQPTDQLFGIWGALTHEQRRLIHRQRRAVTR